MSEHDREIDLNYDYFRRNYTSFATAQAGRIALLRKQSIVDFYDDAGAAMRVANERFTDGLYSLQPVIDEPVDLGFFSHVGR